MRMLCIDPGTRESGYVVWDTVTSTPVEFGVIGNRELKGKLCTPDHRVRGIFIEKPSCMGMTMGSDMIDTLIWVGVFEEASGGAFGGYVKRIEVKRQLLGRTTGGDTQVNAAVREYLCQQHGLTEKELKGKKSAPGPFYGVKSHVWPAIAVALCVQSGCEIIDGNAHYEDKNFIHG